MMRLKSFLFENDITIIEPKNENQAKELLIALSKNGIRWIGGRSLLDDMHLHTRDRRLSYALHKSCTGEYFLKRGSTADYIFNVGAYKLYPKGCMYVYKDVVISNTIYSVI
jgi:hypothetical protein